MPLNCLRIRARVRIRARAWTGFAGIIPQWFSEFSGKERPRSFRRRTDFLEIGHQSGRLFNPMGSRLFIGHIATLLRLSATGLRFAMLGSTMKQSFRGMRVGAL